MSARAQKAVVEAEGVAAQLESEGRRMEAAIIRRLCRSNGGYRVTLQQLWTDNMGLRWAHASLWKDNCELRGVTLPERPPTPTPPNPFEESEVRPRRDNVPSARPRPAPAPEPAPAVQPEIVEREELPSCEFETLAAVNMIWCDQCDRRVSESYAFRCPSPFCKAKAAAA